MPESFTVRPAHRGDVSSILKMIRELADYEHLTHLCTATAAQLKKELFGAEATAQALIAESDGTSVGYAIYFHNLSTFLGRKGLYLEDLFVRPAFRGHGLGRMLLRHLAATAVTAGADFMDWKVLDWNTPAIEFYRSLGAAQIPDWLDYRLEGAALEKLAS